jgi:hypothetical protein
MEAEVGGSTATRKQTVAASSVTNVNALESGQEVLVRMHVLPMKAVPGRVWLARSAGGPIEVPVGEIMTVGPVEAM